MRFGEELRSGLTGTMLAALVLGLVVWLEPQMTYSVRERSSQRACFANQKTLAGVLEMFRMDYGADAGGLDEATLTRMTEQSYLQQIPEDPGVDEGGSWRNYVEVMRPDRVPPRRTVVCLRHGFLQPPEGTTHEDGGVYQLRVLGVDPGRPMMGSWTRIWVPRSLRGLLDVTLPLFFLVASLILVAGVLAVGTTLLKEAFLYLREGPAPPPPARPPKPDLAQARCPVCADGFGAGTPVASQCKDCHTPHHEVCLRYLGHCAVFACSRTELTEARRKEVVEEKARVAAGGASHG